MAFAKQQMEKKFFIKYKEFRPVKIETHIDSGRNKRPCPLEDVGDLVAAVKQALPSKLGAIDLDELTLHLPSGVDRSALDQVCFANSIDTTLRPGLKLDILGGVQIDDLSPLVIKSKNDVNQHLDFSRRNSDPWGQETAVLLWKHGSSDSEGVTIGDNRTVARNETVTSILEVFHENNPLLIKSPPFSGKTSMATLISHRLKTVTTEKCLIIKLSILDLSRRGTDWIFESAFEEEVGVKWSDLPMLAKKRRIYLIFDEVQVIYQPTNADRPPSPKNKLDVFWTMVKSIMGNHASGIHIMLFSGYGSSSESSLLATPVKFTPRSMLGIDRLNFSDTELEEYVVRNLNGSDIIVGDLLVLFCTNLKRLTASHAGFCYATIAYLNDVLCASERKHGTLTADHVLKSLDNSSLFNYLQGTRAFNSAKSISKKELELISSVVSREGMLLQSNILIGGEKQIAESLVLKGVFVEDGAMNEQYVFSSPVMKRFFTEKVFGVPPGRAQENPASLDDLVYAIITSIDYKHIQSSLGKTRKTGILLERAWQMEFYRSSIQCTCDYVTSADVGGLFGTTGAIDFTVHSLDMSVFWGIELLREGNRLEDHVTRFGDDGRYEKMCRKFTKACVLDIRQQPKGATTDLTDLDKYENLIIFIYDDTFSAGVLYSKLWVEGKRVSISH